MFGKVVLRVMVLVFNLSEIRVRMKVLGVGFNGVFGKVCMRKMKIKRENCECDTGF